MAQLVKNLPSMRETWVQSMGGEDRLEMGKATHSSILAWRIPWTIQSMELYIQTRKESDTSERLSLLLLLYIANMGSYFKVRWEIIDQIAIH